MNSAIVIGTYHGREDWSRDCLQSLSGYTDFPIITVTVPYELNVIRWVYENTHLNEFLFLQDTVMVKNYAWLDEVFDHPGSVSLCHKPFFMYLGKYTRKGIDAVARVHGWPQVQTKRDAVTHEGEWTSWYSKANGHRSMWGLEDTAVFEDRHGRNNMVIENDHIVKYKGTWAPEMIEEYSQVPPVQAENSPTDDTVRLS